MSVMKVLLWGSVAATAWTLIWFRGDIQRFKNEDDVMRPDAGASIRYESVLG